MYVDDYWNHNSSQDMRGYLLEKKKTSPQIIGIQLQLL